MALQYQVPLGAPAAALQTDCNAACTAETGMVYVWGFRLGDQPSRITSMKEPLYSPVVSCGGSCLLIVGQPNHHQLPPAVKP